MTDAAIFVASEQGRLAAMRELAQMRRGKPSKFLLMVLEDPKPKPRPKPKPKRIVNARLRVVAAANERYEHIRTMQAAVTTAPEPEEIEDTFGVWWGATLRPSYGWQKPCHRVPWMSYD